MDNNQFKKLAVVSSTQPSASSPKSKNTEMILRCQLRLFAAYRTDQYADPDGYVASLGMVLEQYPEDVVDFITNPRTGIQRTSKFPPTISEIVQACDARVADLKKQERYRNWGRSEVPALEQPRESRPTYEELKAKYGENWGIEQ